MIEPLHVEKTCARPCIPATHTKLNCHPEALTTATYNNAGRFLAN